MDYQGALSLIKVRILKVTSLQSNFFNHWIINKLGTLPPKKKSSWRDVVLTLVQVHNCTRSAAKGFSPYYLMYGQNPTSNWSILQDPQCRHENHNQYKFVQQLQERLKYAYKAVQKVIVRETKGISKITIIRWKTPDACGWSGSSQNNGF